LWNCIESPVQEHGVWPPLWCTNSETLVDATSRSAKSISALAQSALFVSDRPPAAEGKAARLPCGASGNLLIAGR